MTDLLIKPTLQCIRQPFQIIQPLSNLTVDGFIPTKLRLTGIITDSNY